MMTRKFPAPARTFVLTALAASLAGCGMVNSVIDADKVDYRAAKKAAPLDVPPDLTKLEKDNRYAVPDGRGVATASGFQAQRSGTAAVTATGGEVIGQVNTPLVHVERVGSQRWLVVRETPEQLWPQLKEFWHDMGFTIGTESAATGVMETEWAENRAKIPQDFIRNAIGKVFDGLYSTGERDKFRTRLERNPDGTTEVYISHRGVEEVLTGAQKESSAWQPRPNDPNLEAIFLSRLMARLTNTEAKQAKVAVDTAAPQPLHAKLLANAVEVDEGFDRAWRRVGLALDRVGFTVEDRDRTQGIYFVRFVDPENTKEPGFFAKLFGDSDKAKEAQRYRVLVKSAQGAATSQVTVQTNDGKPETTPTGAKILKLLSEELK